MFGRASQFEKCEHKSVTLRRFSGHVYGADLSCPYTEDYGVVVEVRANKIPTNSRLKSKLGLWENAENESCPAYMGVEFAYQHMAETAGKVACGDCSYGRMSPIELSERRADRAEEQLTVVQNDVRRLTALEAKQQGLAEVAILNARIEHPERIFDQA